MIVESRIIKPIPQPPRISRIAFYLAAWDVASPPIKNAQNKTHVELFRRGCFARSIQHIDTSFQIDGTVVASRAMGNVILSEDDFGLRCELTIPAGFSVPDLLKAWASWIHFTAPRAGADRWNETTTERELLDVDLISVGLSIEENSGG